jgi:signal peptidase II
MVIVPSLLASSVRGVHTSVAGGIRHRQGVLPYGSASRRYTGTMQDADTRPATGPRLAIRPRDGWFLALAAAIVGLDQLTKWTIREWLERGEAVSVVWPLKIVHVTNSGAAFGMFQGAGPLLVITSVVGMVAILVYLFNPGFAHPVMRLGLALMLGGAVGNLIDRVAEGRVVDFVKVPNFPAFNVADSAITIGVFFLIWALMFDTTDEPKRES